MVSPLFLAIIPSKSRDKTLLHILSCFYKCIIIYYLCPFQQVNEAMSFVALPHNPLLVPPSVSILQIIVYVIL